MRKLRFRKETIAASILFALTITLASAQQVDNTNVFINSNVVDYNIEYFKVMEVDNELFFKFLITEDTENTAYVLESSTNGETFKPLQIKEGYKSPNNVPLLHCFSEQVNEEEAIIYRVKRVSFNGAFTYSCGLMLDTDNPNRKWNSCEDNNYEEQITFQDEGKSPSSKTVITPIASAY
tara:strand:+ start:3703 stop:4239 length:537 start_codon:yes stop_codon:yes gene_type:complete